MNVRSSQSATATATGCKPPDTHSLRCCYLYVTRYISSIKFFYLFSYFLSAVIFVVMCSLPFVFTVEILKFCFSGDVPHKDKLDTDIHTGCTCVEEITL